MGQQLQLASELKSDRLDTTDWSKKDLVDFDNDKNNIYLTGLKSLLLLM